MSWRKIHAGETLRERTRTPEEAAGRAKMGKLERFMEDRISDMEDKIADCCSDLPPPASPLASLLERADHIERMASVHSVVEAIRNGATISTEPHPWWKSRPDV